MITLPRSDQQTLPSSPEASALTIRTTPPATLPSVDCNVAPVDQIFPIVSASDFFRFIRGAVRRRLNRALALSVVILTSTAINATVQAQFSSPASEIVSAWKFNGGNTILVFGYDGSYYQIQGDAADPGMERGTFQWDKATQAFSVDTIVDTNGEGGLSHPAGATSVSIGGAGNNTLSYTVTGEGTFTFSRILNGTAPSNAIVGTWTAPGEKASITFLADGTYYHAQESNYVQAAEEGDFYTGSEKGTYLWNSTNGILTATQTSDTNGDSGLSDPQPSFVVSISGNTMTIVEGDDTYTLTRITTNPTPLQLPDFTVTRFANYRQSSDATPILRTISDLSPYSADAIINSNLNATAPTLKIGAAAAFSIPADLDEPGSFDFEQEFPTLADLNSFLPASTALEFKDGAAIAGLTTGASLTFPSTPKIITRDGASWSGGVYSFGADEVLQWTLPTGFVASEYLTIVGIYDPVADQDVAHAELHGDVTFLDLSGKLNPDNEYEVEIDFYRIDNSTTAGSGVFAGKQGYVLSASSTIFNVRSRDSFPIAPSIMAQPVSQPGIPSSPVLLTIGINEEAFPFSTFQWFKNDVEIPGQTGNSLFIPSFDKAEHSGNYHVEVQNLAGDAISDSVFIGQAVERLQLQREKISRQISTSLFENDVAAAIYPVIEGVGITETFPASSISLKKPDNSTVPMVFEEYHWTHDSEFINSAALVAAFPSGLYHFTIGADSVPVSFGADHYPNQPVVTPSAGTWVGGKLRITASQAAAGFTLTTNSSTGIGWVQLSLSDSSDTELLYVRRHELPDTQDFAQVTVPAGLLSVGQTYSAEASFDDSNEVAIAGSYSWESPNGLRAYNIYMLTTRIEIEVVADSLAPYTSWQSSFFNPTQLANSAISGDNVDFDNDGIENLLEYLLGGNPTLPSSGLLPTASKDPGSNNLVFTYKRKIAATGVTQAIEHSTDLSSSWPPAVHGQNGVTIVTSSVPGDATREQVTVTIPSTSASRFVRLNAGR